MELEQRTCTSSCTCGLGRSFNFLRVHELVHFHLTVHIYVHVHLKVITINVAQLISMAQTAAQ